MSVGKTIRKNNSKNNAVSVDLTTPSNNKHCVCLNKLYDWVKIRNGQQVPFEVPEDDLEGIERAIIIGHTIGITAIPDCEDATVKVALIDRIDDQCACITLEKIISVEVTIIDETDGCVLSEFTQENQIFETVRVCFPVGMPESAIDINILNCEAIVLSSRPVNGEIIVEIITCQEIKICLEVIVKVRFEEFCVSREGISCDDIIGGVETCESGEETFPEQCAEVCTDL
jgi:hypothetical protein